MNFANIGFDTPDEEEEFFTGYVDWKDGKIDPRLCDRMEEESDCPFNECQRACLDCDVILHPDDLRFDLKHLDMPIEEE